MKEKKNSAAKNSRSFNFVWIIILALIFGLGGGAAAVYVARPYLTQYVQVPAPADQQAASAQESLRQANSVIENAKQIVAGQQNKVNDTIIASQNSLVGVYKISQSASSTASAGKPFSITDYYKLSDAIAEGIVVTSDGWVLTADFTKNAAENSIIKNFIVITKTNDVYNIDKVSQSGIASYIFIHLSNAKNLPVKSFISKMDLTDSQTLVALNWLGESYLTSIVDKVSAPLAVKDSDVSSESIVLANDLGAYFDNAFIFSMNGQVVGYFDKKNGPVPIYDFQPMIEGLLAGVASKPASLGVSYVNLQEYAIKDTGYGKGALIYSNSKSPAVKPGSSAAVAGLQAGDIILSVDNINIDALHDLGDILAKYSAGDTINIIYERAGAENSINVKLQAIK